MSEGVIGMEDMRLIFTVTDAMGIHRERVSVPLGKEDPGAVRMLPGGEVEIVVPATTPLEAWLPILKQELERLGFVATEAGEEEEE
ncbi:MAG: hypothetical protein HY686_08070 [Chloroflexi bacterium]|nr:hypothetical protein [Chloroflexota bacterium]